MDARHLFGDIAQLGEHLPCTQGVESSNLFVSIRDIDGYPDNTLLATCFWYLENRIQKQANIETTRSVLLVRAKMRLLFTKAMIGR